MGDLTSRQSTILIIVLVVSALALAVIVGYMIHVSHSRKDTTAASASFTKYFGVNDGLKLSFCTANTPDAVESSGCQILQNNGNDIDEWLKAVEKVVDSGNKKGVLLNLQNFDEFEEVAGYLSGYLFPIWLQVHLPQTLSDDYVNRLNKYADEHAAHFTLALALNTWNNDVHKFLDKLSKQHPVVLDITALGAITKETYYPEIRSLVVNKDKDVVLLTKKGPKLNENSDEAFALVELRNDLPLDKVYFILDVADHAYFKNLATLAAAPVNFYGVKDREAIRVSWAHAVNSQTFLAECLDGPLMMFETDCLLRAPEPRVPVMAHPPATDSDLLLESFLKQMIESKKNKGIKLDIKSMEVMPLALDMMSKKKTEIEVPVLQNSDVLQGPRGGTPRNATAVLAGVNQDFPECTLSLGWTTGGPATNQSPPYTSLMIDEAIRTFKDVKQPITFPIRAAILLPSWSELKRLLNTKVGYTLTVWTSSVDTVDPKDMASVFCDYDPSRIYFDLPTDLYNAVFAEIEARKKADNCKHGM